MKKNVIALLLAVVMASGSIVSVPALAAETTAEAAVAVEEEIVEEATYVSEETETVEASVTTEQEAVAVEEETVDSEEVPAETEADEAKEEIDESEIVEDSSEAESVQAAEEDAVSETEVLYENDSINEELTAEDDIQQSEIAVVPESNEVKESKNAGIPFDGGSGTQEDPYKVSTAEQLNAVRDYPEAYFIQTTDINMSSINNWVPIGKESDQCFWGSYDGKGHTISNLKIKNDGSETYIGLFGYVGPEIKNLKLENTSIEIDLSLCSGPIQVGTLAGDAPVLNCSTHGTIIVTGSDSYGCDLGGIVGRAQGIENSNSDVAITVNCNGSKDMNIGGLAGECLHGSATNSYFKGSIKTSGDCVHIGGIIGITDWSGEVNNCVNYGNISVSNDSAGSTAAGVVAYPYDDSASAENCVNFGNIIGSDETFVAGITRADNSTVHNCYNLGDIEGNPYSGRIYTSDARNVNAYSNYGYENATVNGSIPSGGLQPSGFNGMNMSVENLRFVTSDILEDCGCEWEEPLTSHRGPFSVLDMYGFSNPGEKIKKSIYDKYFPKAYAYALHKEFEKKRHGLCYGVVISAMASLAQLSPPVTSFGVTSLNEIKDPNKTTSSALGISLLKYIEYAYVLQFTPFISKMDSDNKGKMAALHNAVLNYVNGNTIEPVYVSIEGVYNDEPDARHELLVLGIAKDTNTNTIYDVYDCNHPGEQKKLILYKKNGDYTSWEYQLFNNTLWTGTGEKIRYTVGDQQYFVTLFATNALYETDEYNVLITIDLSDTSLNVSEDWWKKKWFDKKEYKQIKPASNLGQTSDNSIALWYKSNSEDLLLHDVPANAKVTYATTTDAMTIIPDRDCSISLSGDDSFEHLGINGNDQQLDFSAEYYCPNNTDDSIELLTIEGTGEEIEIDGSKESFTVYGVSDISATYEKGKEDEDGIIQNEISSTDEVHNMDLEDPLFIKCSTDDNVVIEEPSFSYSGTEAWDGDEYGFNQRKLNWKFESNGTLRIRYEGLSTDETYSLQNADYYSWKEYNNSVLELHVGKNISNLGRTSLDGYPKLRRLFFEYDPPTFMTDNSVSSPLTGKTLEIHYPADNTAWNGVTGSNYGGNIKWEPCYSGVCGNDLAWVLDSKGTLVISGSGAMYNWTDETKTPWHEHVTDIKSIVIKNGVKNIGTAAFKKCTNVSDVRIGNTVTDIGNYAFYECGHLKTIKIPSKVTNIGDAAFALCSEINTITIPGNVSNIGKCAFEGCSGLKSVTIDEGVENIDKWAFNMCGNLLNVMIPASVTIIGDDAFANCSKDLIISGKGTSYAEKYAKEKGLTFIDPFYMDYAIVTGLTAKTYSGKAITQTLTVKIGSTTLTPNTDFTVSYKNNINAGTATVVITGKGNYTGTVTKTFTINKAAQSITAISSAATVSVGKTATVSTTGTKGNVKYSSSNAAIATVDSKTGKVTAKKVGTVTITAQSAATANYNVASKAVTVKVVPAATASLSAANLSTGIKLTWKKVAGANGYIIYRNGTKIKTITSGTTVTYSDTKANTNGKKYTYKVVAKATTGTSTLSRSRIMYRVARTAVSSLASRTAGKMTVKWKRNSKANGYIVQYSKSKSFSSGNKTATITKNTLINKTIGSLTKGKKYYVRVRCFKTVSGKKYYSAWSAVKAVTVKK